MPEAPWYDPTAGNALAVDDAIAQHAASSAAAAATVHDNGNSGSAVSISRANGKYQKLTLTASGATVTVAGFTAGQYDEIILYVVQDATGTRTVPTFSPAGRYGSVGAPTLSTAAASIDILKLSSINGGTSLDITLVEKGA